MLIVTHGISKISWFREVMQDVLFTRRKDSLIKINVTMVKGLLAYNEGLCFIDH